MLLPAERMMFEVDCKFMVLTAFGAVRGFVCVYLQCVCVGACYTCLLILVVCKRGNNRKSENNSF